MLKIRWSASGRRQAWRRVPLADVSVRVEGILEYGKDRYGSAGSGGAANGEGCKASGELGE